MRFSLLLLALATSLTATAQSRVWVYLDGKPTEGTPALSAEAMQRRAEQGISLGSHDWPVDAQRVRCLENAGCKVMHTSRWLNAVSVETTLSPDQLKAACPAVKDVQPVRSLTRNIAELPVPAAPSAKAMGSPYGFSVDQIQLSGIDCLHEAGFRGEGITIAQFDAGWTTADTSRAFAIARSEGRIAHQWDFVDGDGDVYGGSFHGLFVLGAMAADLSGELMGSAPKATYLLARTEDESREVHAEEDNWLAAVEWADSLGADVINSSLGYSEFDPGEGNYTYADMDGNTTIITKAADMAASLGILVVNSAGNQGSSPWHYITAPCDADSILCVGAVDKFAVAAGFSSFGPASDGQVKPDIMAMGVDVATIDPWGSVGFTSGTSLSSPVAAGMAACLLQKHPTATNMEVILALQQAADRYTTPDSAYGYGLPKACTADSILIPLSVADAQDAHPALTAWPNPGSTQLTLHATGRIVQITLTDAAGRTVLTHRAEGQLQTLSTASLPAGCYAITAQLADGSSASLRWVKQ